MNNRVHNSQANKELNFKLIMISIVIVLGMGGLGFGWYHCNQKLKAQEAGQQQFMKKKDKELQMQKEKVNEAKEEAKLAVQNNTNPETKENKAMYECIHKVMTCLFNYDKDTYTTRADELDDELSKKMKYELFPTDVKNYMGEIESKLDECIIYHSVYYKKSGDKKLLVEVDYETKVNEKAKAVKQQSIWKVTYNSNKNQITNLEQVGLIQG